MPMEIFGGLIESLKQKRIDSKVSKELIKALDITGFVDWKKYSKLSINVANELIKQGYGKEVVEHIDNFGNDRNKVIDSLMCAGYDITKFVLYDDKYKLTYNRILNLIMYKPGLICSVGSYRAKISVDEKTWERFSLVDYAYFEYSGDNPKLRNKDSLEKIRKKYFDMSDEEVKEEYRGRLSEDGRIHYKKFTLGYAKAYGMLKDILVKSQIKALKKHI